MLLHADLSAVLGRATMFLPALRPKSLEGSVDPSVVLILGAPLLITETNLEDFEEDFCSMERTSVTHFTHSGAIRQARPS